MQHFQKKLFLMHNRVKLEQGANIFQISEDFFHTFFLKKREKHISQTVPLMASPLRVAGWRWVAIQID